MESPSELSGVEPGLARLFNCKDSLIISVMAFPITAVPGARVCARRLQCPHFRPWTRIGAIVRGYYVGNMAGKPSGGITFSLTKNLQGSQFEDWWNLAKSRGRTQKKFDLSRSLPFDGDVAKTQNDVATGRKPSETHLWAEARK